MAGELRAASQWGQAAKACEDRRVLSLPFLGRSRQPVNEPTYDSENRLLHGNLNPAKAVGVFGFDQRGGIFHN